MEPATELRYLSPLRPDSQNYDVQATGISNNQVERGSQHTENRDSQEFSLPQADGGKDAWLFLISCFIVEALVWGFPFSFGVFQVYYSTHEPFSSQSSGIAAVGTTATGIMYIIGVVLFPIYKRWPHLRRLSPYAGVSLMALSLLLASFVSKTWHLLLTQGVLYGIGGSIVYYPTILFVDEWFIRRKGFAFGIMWAGTGSAGLVVPFVLSSLLDKYGFRTTLRAWAVAVLVISTPMLMFLRPRLPVSSTNINPRLDLSFMRSSTFWLLQVGNIVEALGYFIPQLYLPTYSTSLNLPTSNGTLLLSLVNTASVLSAIIMGMLVDRFHVTTVICISTIGATASILLVWGFSTSLPVLIVFALLYGLFAGGFTSTYTGVIKEVKKKSEGADVGILIGLLSAGRGIGAIVSGPLSEALLKLGPLVGEGVAGYGSGYGGLIVFTGVTTAVGGVSFLGRRMGWM